MWIEGERCEAWSQRGRLAGEGAAGSGEAWRSAADSKS